MVMVRSKYGVTTQEEYLRRKAMDTQPEEKVLNPLVKNTIAYELNDFHRYNNVELSTLINQSQADEDGYSCFKLSEKFGKLGFSSNIIASYTEDFTGASTWAVKNVKPFTGAVMGVFSQLASTWLKEDGFCSTKAFEMIGNLDGWSPECIFPDYRIDGFDCSENLTCGFLGGKTKTVSKEVFEKQRSTNALAKIVYDTCDKFEKLGITVGRVRFCIHGSVGMDFSKISEYSCYTGVGDIFRSPYAERNTSGDWTETVSDEYEIAYILYAEPRKNPMSVSFLRDCAEACDVTGLSEEQLIELDRQRLASDPSKYFRFDEAVEKMRSNTLLH